MIRPARLRPGSRVAVVAPAGPVSPESLREGVAVLEGWGLVVEVGKHVLDRHPRLPYLAGRDADRAAEFQRAWCDPDVDAVICARGGYGCLRMVDRACSPDRVTSPCCTRRSGRGSAWPPCSVR